MSRRTWVVVLVGASMVFFTMGTRQSIGLFLKPVTEDLDTDRESFALALAAHNLILGLPVAAMLSDRLGPRRVVAGAGLLMGAGLAIASRADSVAVFGVSLALLFGIAVSGSSFVVVIGAVGKEIPISRQSFAFGLITAGASMGMFVMVPIAQGLIDAFGWRGALAVLAVVAVLVIAGASALLPADDPTASSATDHAIESMSDAVRRAVRNRSYLLLTAGFFVCGFHVAFIAAHLPAYLTDEGLSDRTAAIALSMVGLFNIAGSLTAGWLGDRYRRRTLLAGLYLSRAVVMSAFLVVPLTSVSAVVFGAVMGVLWLSTVPLTSGLVAAMYGPRYLSSLFGLVFLSHQVGAFLGVWLGGRAFDSTGSYDPVWAVAVVLGVAAALIHIPIAVGDDRSPAPSMAS
ncbi:MFS transporter [Ilumatobacter sp.]|uniref:MFS transporter n=1 Tax=Ilumatobacter sp. TaxID=1967498 RepID=UPI003AF533A9